MNRTRSNYLKVGITVVLAVVILLYGIAFLKSFKVDVETNDLIAYFTDINGLKEGDPVSVNGVPKGKVTAIDLAGDSVKVSFRLGKDVLLKKDYNITVAMIELMSGKQIAIKPGKSHELADITKPLTGSKANDVITLIETMNNVGDQVSAVAMKMDSTIESLNLAVKNINDIVGDPGLKSDIKSTAGNFNAASINLNSLLVENRNNLRNLTSRLNSIADNVDNTITDAQPEIKETMGDIRSLTSRLDSIAFSLNQFITDTRDPEGTVGKLISDDKLYENLNKTVISLDKLIKQINNKGIRLRLF
ncbi:MAG: MCE family protein [Ignavibacteriae bacterium]|nr:MAG: MCE family protein [Ignavibacteriota bacterium]